MKSEERGAPGMKKYPKINSLWKRYPGQKQFTDEWSMEAPG